LSIGVLEEGLEDGHLDDEDVVAVHGFVDGKVRDIDNVSECGAIIGQIDDIYFEDIYF
jgi:hypothetical protein